MHSTKDIKTWGSKPRSNEMMDDTGDTHFVPAPCQVACPIGTDAPSYLAYIWEGNLEGALEAITATNPLSSICGRVCDAPCEPACRRADSDGPIAIRNLKRYVMDQLGPNFKLPPVPVTQEQTIGIVGSGPAGLTAAQDLAEAGYEVHLYEMTDRLGGMAIWGIPAFRLPQHIIQEDINRILHHCPGIKVHLNCALGKDVTLDDLKEQHDAVLLAIGSWWGKKMSIPGEGHTSVVDGVGFLRDINAGARPTMPETVLVLGAGDVSMDACRVAKRLPGCKHVIVLYRRGPNEIPARKDELIGAIEEKVEFVYYTQPKEIIPTEDGLILRCLKTVLGKPDTDGRRRPILVPDSEHDFSCGLIIAAIGQKGACEELSQLGMMENDRVKTDFSTMQTTDPKVFGAGDGAFGPSTLVNAMYHGHRCAYYMKAFLEGYENPLPYRTPYRTRRVPVSQDPEWEIINRQEQEFHGLGENPIEFPEIESKYDLDSAKKEAARCYRCDAENGTAEYTVRNREDIFLMARTDKTEQEVMEGMLSRRLTPRDDPFGESHQGVIDDIHFLPANLSRLVIDPYREACKTETVLSKSFKIQYPFFATGFNDAPKEVRRGLAKGLESVGCPYIGRQQLSDNVPWFQLLTSEDSSPGSSAAGLIYTVSGNSLPSSVKTLHEQQLSGLLVTPSVLEKAIPFAIEEGCDLLLLDGTVGIGTAWPELKSVPDLTVLRESIRILREIKKEGEITLVYFGGIRSGTDAAKVIAMGCDAVVLEVALGISLHGEIESSNNLHFNSDLNTEERQEAVENFLKANASEVSMMARCTGKTNIHNLEPEDLRCITKATATATGIPLVGS